MDLMWMYSKKYDVNMFRVEFTFYGYRFSLLKNIGGRWDLVSSVKVIAGSSGNRCVFYNHSCWLYRENRATRDGYWLGWITV